MSANAVTWLFDLGNTRLKCAPLHRDDSIGEAIAVAHDGSAYAADWMAVLPPRIDSAQIASVAAEPVRVALLDALATRCGRLSLACTLPRFAGIAIAYAQPRRLGVDRFLALAAARARASTPALVVGVGTALTLDLVDGEGRHRGGRIAPSPELMRAALHARAAQLPATGGHYAEFATDTEDALASGCAGAALGLIERSLRSAHALLGTMPALCLHGGGAEALRPHLPMAEHAPNLVLEGLALWARME